MRLTAAAWLAYPLLQPATSIPGLTGAENKFGRFLLRAVQAIFQPQEWLLHEVIRQHGGCDRESTFNGNTL